MSYRAITFDLGGVLLDSEGAHENAARRVAAHFGIFIPEGNWSRIRGGAYESFFDQALALPENARRRLRATDLVPLAYDLYHEEVRRSSRMFPDVIEVLEVSRATFEFVAMATSSEWRLVDAVLRQFDLAGYFDGVITGDHITQKKPAAEAFLVAAWLLGIKPASMVVVEDSLHGIRAARLARAHVIGIATTTDPQSLRPCNPHHVVCDHAELAEHIHAMARAGSIARRAR